MCAKVFTQSEALCARFFSSALGRRKAPNAAGLAVTQMHRLSAHGRCPGKYWYVSDSLLQAERTLPRKGLASDLSHDL